MNAWINAVANNAPHAAFAGRLLEVLLESLIILLAVSVWCFCFRRTAAATKHLIWFLALAGLPFLLCLSGLPHSWQKPLWSVSTGIDSGNQFSLSLTLAPLAKTGNSTSPVSPANAEGAFPTPANSADYRPLAARFNVSWLVCAFVFWAGGAALGLIFVFGGQLRLRSMPRKAHPLGSPDWDVLLREVCATLRLRRLPTLLQAGEDLMPVTWGWWRPMVLLPAEAAHWPASRRRVVLLHELAHVKRWDCLTQTIARIICALLWVNPLVWLAARRMCVERERACDDLVLNAGCKASDYAAQLLEIARTFRQARTAPGIAMARSAQLQGRIAAIVDDSRARGLRPGVALAVLASMIALVGCLGGSAGKAVLAPNEAERSSLRGQQIAQLESFSLAKEKQAEALAQKDGTNITPDFRRFFDAAIRGDFRTVTNRYAYFKHHHPQYSNSPNTVIESLRTPYWGPVLEICLAYDQVANCEPRYTKLLAEGIITSIPPGSIYFGGTDTGRGVPTAFEKSSIDGDPFFCLTQNALADATYLDYLRAMYGGKIYTLTADDSQRCFQDYLQDARKRLQANQLDPGEGVKVVENSVQASRQVVVMHTNGRLAQVISDHNPTNEFPGEDVKVAEKPVQVSGQVAVMNINGLLTKVIFDHNPTNEFFVEESFPLKWMYPYLEPHGLIMKIDRQPQRSLPDEVLARDHEYWRALVAGMIGDWLSDGTRVTEVTEFVNRVYVRHDLAGFTGDPLYIQNDYAKRIFSKLRTSITGLYAWRLGPQCPPEYRPQSKEEVERLRKDADFAFRQAFALCPYSPETVFRYVNFLIQFNRAADALLVAQSCQKLDPHNEAMQDLIKNLQNVKKSETEQQGNVEQAKSNLQKMENEVRDHPTNYQAAFDLASAYFQMHDTNRANQILDGVLNRPNVESNAVLGVAQACAQMQNWPKLEATLEKMVKIMPDKPEAWYDLAAFKANAGKTGEAIPALRQALELNAKRLLADPKARDLLASARTDEHFHSLRQSAEFQKLVPP